MEERGCYSLIVGMKSAGEFRTPIRYAESVGAQYWVETDGGTFLLNPETGNKRLISDCTPTYQ